MSPRPSLHIPHCRIADYRHASDRSMASQIIIDPATAGDCRVAILGCPSDLGVRLNHGRPGASEGPGAIRAALSRYGVRTPGGFDWPKVFDAGDVIAEPGDDAAALHRWHARVRDAAKALAERDMITIGLGGGHDHTLPLAGVWAARHPGLVVLYADAHLDVRDTVGSGMPFRKLSEDHGVREFRVVGLNPLVNAREHEAWFRAHGGRVIECAGGRIEHPDRLIPSGPCYVSIDLDAIDGTAAPGVSALNPAGLSVHDVAALAHAAGKSPHVRALDIMEFSPPLDQGGRTARVAAHLVLEFLRGVAERP